MPVNQKKMRMTNKNIYTYFKPHILKSRGLFKSIYGSVYHAHDAGLASIVRNAFQRKQSSFENLAMQLLPVWTDLVLSQEIHTKIAHMPS